VKTLPDKKLAFAWLGVAGIKLCINSHTLLIDPFLTRPPLHNVLWGRPTSNTALLAEKIPQADHILVTHAHYDHLMDVPEIALRTGAIVLGSFNTYQLMQILGVPVTRLRVIHAGDEISLPYAQVKVMAGRHPFIPAYTPGRLKRNLCPPLRLCEYRMDDCFSFHIQAAGMQMLVWSSVSSQAALPADMLLLRAVANPRWYRDLLAQVKPRLAIPTHWDDQFRELSEPVRPFFSPPMPAFPPIQRINLQKFTDRIHHSEPACRVLVPEIFQLYDLHHELGQRAAAHN